VKYKEGKGKVKLNKIAWDKEAIGREAMEVLLEPLDVSIVIKLPWGPLRSALEGVKTKGYTKK
jgi:hypothetical protein